MTVDDERQPFYNKIFFCDVIGYSRLDAIEQYACQRSLNAAVLAALGALGTRLDEDVIALPTGDGLILNFLAPAPDLHLRTALHAMETLASSEEGRKVVMRIGLNSHVDTWVRDINGKRNVVGSGINMAQRVMDLGAHGQILMHDRVCSDLDSFPAYQGKLHRIGSFSVKHGVELPIAQFIDPQSGFLSPTLLAPRPALPATAFDFDDVINRRVVDSVLSLSLDRRAGAQIPAIEDFIEAHLDAQQTIQASKIWVSWIASELIANALAHSPPHADDRFELKLGKTRSGVLVSLVQPDVPAFDLQAVLRDPARSDSFMQMMQRRGLRWSEHRLHGRLELGVELPDALNPRPMPALALRIDPDTANLPTPVAAYLDDVVDRLVDGKCWYFRAGTIGNRLGEENWQRYLDALRIEIDAAVAGNASKLVLDLTPFNRITSRGLRCLSLARSMAGERLEIMLVSGSRSIVEQLQVSRYDKLFRVFFSTIEAYRAMAAVE